MEYPLKQQRNISRQDIREVLVLKNHVEALLATHNAMVYRLHVQFGLGAHLADDVDMDEAVRAFQYATIPNGYGHGARSLMAVEKKPLQSD